MITKLIVVIVDVIERQNDVIAKFDLSPAMLIDRQSLVNGQETRSRVE